MRIRRFFSLKWLLPTVFAILAVGVMIRLGIWQLDRLEQRRMFNTRVIQEVEREQLELTTENLSLDLDGMEYRKVVVEGYYDFSQEVALRNQVWNDRIGVHLLTPLIIVGTDYAVFVDRGWIPQEAYLSADWSEYADPGIVRVEGVIRLAQSKAELGSMRDEIPVDGERLLGWNLANISQIARQIPYPVLPIYIQQSPESEQLELPYKSVSIPELSEGSHMSYAIQWFTFALITAVGYPIMVRNKERNK